MKYFAWDEEKNERLRAQRGISFEGIVFHVQRGDLLDVLEHPNQEKYRDQKLFVVDSNGYIHLVPFVESATEVFLKTIIPRRSATKRYLPGGKP